MTHIKNLDVVPSARDGIDVEQRIVNNNGG